MQKFNDSLLGRILAIFFAVLSASGLVYLIFISNQGILPRLLQWALIAGLGFVAGFSARFMLAGRTLALRWLTALLALLGGLVFLGLISRGWLGARLPQPEQADLNLGWLGQFGLAGLAAWFSLSAWKLDPRPQSGKKGSGEIEPGKSGPDKKGSKKTGSARTVTAKKRAPARKSTAKKNAPEAPKKSPPKRSSQPAAASPEPALPRLARPEFWQEQWLQIQSSLRRWWEHGLPESPHAPAPRHRKKPAIRLQAKRQQLQTKRPRRPASSEPAPASNSGVRLIGKEEHRCPYCLEEVVEDDPRGIKICPICNTYHHADCWAVTGTCQVPHYHD
jgi:hypothetical protein